MALVKYNDNSISAVTSTGLAEGSLVPIKTLTASSSSTLSFVDGSDGVVLDSTYPIYKFEFNNIHPATNNVNLQFNMSSDGGSNYNITKTTTQFRASHGEDDGGATLEYRSGEDLAQSTSFQSLIDSTGNDNDQSTSGTLTLYNPSSTVFVKHFISNMNGYRQNDQTTNVYTAGYGNTTSSIDAVRFQMSSGNIDSGTIKLYGIKDS